MDNNTISEERFYEDFVSKIKMDYWSLYKNTSNWTKCVINCIKEIVEDYGFSAQTEYFNIDVCGWINAIDSAEREKAKEVGLKPHLWKLKVVIEHENDKKDWTDELVKLTFIRCPLKVVIGYVPYDERHNGGLEEKRVNYASDLLSRSCGFDLTAKERYLLIFGNAAGQGKNGTDYSNYDYRGYYYDYTKTRFIRLT